MAEKVYYCNTCQKANQYSNIQTKINDLTNCFTNDEYIKSSFYQKSYALLKEIRDFGEKDSNNPRCPNVDAYFTLDKFNDLKNQLITHHFYDDIINSINNNSNSNKQYEIIYGSYWTSLKSTLENINISNTKYQEKNCCSCYGECSCYGQCGCYGYCSCNDGWQYYSGCQETSCGQGATCSKY